MYFEKEIIEIEKEQIMSDDKDDKTEEPIVFLKCNELTLRPPLESDISLLLRWINDPDIRQFLDSYLPQMEAHERKWFENLNKDGGKNITLIIVVDNKPIGIMGINSIDWKDNIGLPNEIGGRSDVIVAQPTATFGYTFRLNPITVIAPTISLGYEINVWTDGEPTGEGAIFLLGFHVGRRFGKIN